MKTEYMIVALAWGEILHEELGPINDLEVAEKILKLYEPSEFHLAYIATRQVSEWEKI